MLGKRCRIKNCDQVVSDLWGIEGVVLKSMFVDHSNAREFFGRSKEKCPDYSMYWIQFDSPILHPGNLEGYKGIWSKKEVLEEI